MKIIFGLGNYGLNYDKTRHNVGKIVLENLNKIYKGKDFVSNPKFIADTSNLEINGHKVVLAFPNSFINNSGKSVLKFSEKGGKKFLDDIIVIHDDIDIPFGKIKASYDRSSAGHNGIESIIKNMKSQKFLRIRVGVAKSNKKGVVKKLEEEKLINFLVEKSFSADEIAELQKISKNIAQAIEVFLKKGREFAIQEANTK